MRAVRVFILHFEHILEHRARSFVWFLVSLFNPLLFILFWKGAYSSTNDLGSGWTFPFLTSYYFLLTIAASFLMAHIEEDIVEYDIGQGELVKYLVRPFSYYWFKFFEEIHYRVLQGLYGVVLVAVFYIFFGSFITFASDPLIIFLAVVITVLALFLAFTFKMILGLTAIWMIESRALFQIVEVILVIFAGYIMPVELFSRSLATFAYALPFSYMIYFPVVAFLGKLSSPDLLRVVAIQIVWLSVLVGIYKLMWRRGLLKFTGAGQ